MFTYVLRRIIHAVPILLGVTSVTFLLIYVVPGDPVRLTLGLRTDLATVESIREEKGLNDPLPVQYVRFLLKAMKGDLDRSYSTNEEVLPAILKRVPATFSLALCSMVLAAILGTAIGILSAVKRNSLFDNGSMVVALVGISIPVFFLGLIIAWLFGFILRWFPISGYGTLAHLVLPSLTLGTRPLAIFARLTRSSFLDVLGQDYIRTARAKGLGYLNVLLKHALKNALNPVITIIGGTLSALMAGAFFVEYIFNWPGIGLLAISAINEMDLPMIQGTVLFTAFLFILVNILTDVGYGLLDPRIKLGD